MLNLLYVVAKHLGIRFVRNEKVYIYTIAFQSAENILFKPNIGFSTEN